MKYLLPMLAGCLQAPAYVYPIYAPGIEFTLFSLNAGVHPHDDILVDPNNLFRFGGVGAQTKWDLLDGAGPVATYYAWGTLLAQQPTGEHQFYTATALSDMYKLEQAGPEDLWAVREMSIAGFQALLDHFPDSVTYDAAGRFGFALAPLAYDGILALGGVPHGGWVRITLADGGTTVIQAPGTIVSEPAP